MPGQSAAGKNPLCKFPGSRVRFRHCACRVPGSRLWREFPPQAVSIIAAASINKCFSSIYILQICFISAMIRRASASASAIVFASVYTRMIGFRIRFAQVYPILREIDFNTVRIVHLFIGITGFHLTQYFIHVDGRCQLDLVLRGEIGRISLAQLGHGHTFFRPDRSGKCAAPTSASRP